MIDIYIILAAKIISFLLILKNIHHFFIRYTKIKDKKA